MNKKTISRGLAVARQLAAGVRARASRARRVQRRGGDDRGARTRRSRAAEITCQGVVQAYLERVKAYNGTCTALVTADGKPIAPATGHRARRASRSSFRRRPSRRRPILPDLDQYEGLPLEFGRMEPTISDPSVQQQFGMRVGIPNAGQVNALETLNIRGERSVTCKGKFDAHPSTGPLPQGRAGGVRGVPQAAGRARARRRARRAVRHESGSRSDADVLRHVRVEELVRREGHALHGRQRREFRDGRAAEGFARTSRTCATKGAIIFGDGRRAAKTGLGFAAGPRAPAKLVPAPGQLAYAAWGGQPCNPYDTERVPRGSSSGSGVSVSRELRGVLDLRAGSARARGRRHATAS